MKLQKQVALELIGLHVEQYLKYKDGLHSERILRARALVEAGKVHATEHTGIYLVDSQTTAGVQYRVNGLCECPDATRAEAGRCKHRIAASLYKDVRADLEAMIEAGIPHEHAYTCGHAVGKVHCWDGACREPVDVVCGACDYDERKQHARPDGATDLQEAVQARLDTEELAGNPQGIPYADPATYALEMYEPNPQTRYHAAGCPAIQGGTCVCVTAPLPIVGQVLDAPAMPEAPASVNIKIKKGNLEVMVTLRSMRPGAEGDTEILSRLPAALAGLEAALGVTFGGK